jgi:hypothetical protein
MVVWEEKGFIMAFKVKKSYLLRNFHPCGLYHINLDLFLRKLTSVQILSISSNNVYSPRICLFNPFKSSPKPYPQKGSFNSPVKIG